jgi:hypothetical protein
MQEVFLLCLALGAGVLVVQVILGIFGFAHDADAPGDAAAGDGLDLLSVRSLSAGAVLFGAVGLWLNGRGLPGFVAVAAAFVAGAIATVATALVTRQLLRLESDGSLQLENAVGRSGTVYLPVPARRSGYGMVQFELQGRTVELRAVADEAAIIPTGTPVIVTGLMEDDTVEVTPTPLIEGIDA